MKVLIAFERWGVVRDAFIAAGHTAVSCDLEPSARPGPHVIGDVRPLLRMRWDLVIAHPECSKLSRARGKHADPDEIGEAIDVFVECYRANAPRVAVENPIPFAAVSRFLGPPQCKVDPYHFGDNYRKRTWFWTRGLPPLMPLMSSDHPSYWVAGTIRNRSTATGLGVRNAQPESTVFPRHGRSYGCAMGRAVVH